MRLPAVTDATARYVLLTCVGVLLLAALPATALGDRPLWWVFGRPGPTLVSLIGIVPIVAAWLYFIVVVVVKRSAWAARDLPCRVALLAGALGVLAVVGALLLGDRRVAIGALVFTAATHLVLAVRLRRLLSVVDRSEPEASAGLP